MLRVLLAKDLRRARRNPLPWLINLIVPLVMTALIGLVFGGSSGGALGKIRFAVVNENTNRLSNFLHRAATSVAGQSSSDFPLEPVFTNRVEAMREINANQISAVLIIPTNFLHDYLAGSRPVSLQLIKNPAESVHPAVLEEGLGALVTAMNAVAHNFQSEFPELQTVVDGDADYQKISGVIDHVGGKLKAAKDYLNPPLVSYTKETPADETNHVASAGGTTTNNSGNDIFAYLLIGLSAMFLLFIAGNAMNDLYKELRLHTFERYQTLRDSLVPFLVSKAMFAVVTLALGGALLFGGGGLIFRIQWEHPFALAILTLGYACFAATFYAVLVAMMPDERRSAVLSSLAGLGLGLIGGCAFPPQQLPAFLRENITQHLPSYWFVDTMRDLQYGTDAAWGLTLLKLVITSAVLLVLAAMLFRRKFKSGRRA
jgi:ABC-type polysaccharide/polyol phosphate export permease